MIQEIEYQNSILCSGFGAAWNSKTQSDINPTKNVYRATIKHSIKDPFSHLVFDIPLQVFIIRSKFKIRFSTVCQNNRHEKNVTIIFFK